MIDWTNNGAAWVSLRPCLTLSRCPHFRSEAWLQVLVWQGVAEPRTHAWPGLSRRELLPSECQEDCGHPSAAWWCAESDWGSSRPAAQDEHLAVSVLPAALAEICFGSQFSQVWGESGSLKVGPKLISLDLCQKLCCCANVGLWVWLPVVPLLPLPSRKKISYVISTPL